VAERKEYERFLRERGLTRSFRDYQSLKGKRRFITEMTFSNYDGHSRREKVILVRNDYGVQFRSFDTLKVLGRTREKSFSKALYRLDEHKVERITVRGKDIEIKRPKLRLKNQVTYGSYNKSLARMRNRTYSNVPVVKIGHVVAKIKALKSGRWVFQEAHSSGGYVLRDKQEVRKALDEAIGNCFAALEFTPDAWELVDWWFGSIRDDYGVKAHHVR
jgi:hypothetical protein